MTDEVDVVLRSMNDVPHSIEGYEKALQQLADLRVRHPTDRRMEEVAHILTMELTGLEYMERLRRGLA